MPVTGTTSIVSITASTIGIADGILSRSGVSEQLRTEVCGRPYAGVACNSGGGNFGGAMGLVGAVNLHVVPNIIVIPLDLSAAGVGQGGATTSPFTIDAAGWTTGVASVNTGGGVFSISGLSVAPRTTGNHQVWLTLVTPTFVNVLGNRLPVFATMTFTRIQWGPWIPEPGTLLLFGTGLAGLVAVGRHRS